MTPSAEILLVEDNPSDAELALRALRTRNLADRVHHVSDGVEALAFLAASPRPKVVLLDLKLPKVDGLEVLQRLKSDERTRTLPVVVLTSSREERDVRESYERGANSYIVKPVDFEAFVAAVLNSASYWLHLNQSPA